MTLELIQQWKYTCDFCGREEILEYPNGALPMPYNWVRIQKGLEPPSHYCPLCVEKGADRK